MKKIYLDYPSTKRGDKLDDFYTILTYISVLTVIIGSYLTPGDKYFYIVIVLELVYSMLFLADFILRMSLSRFSWKFLLNPFSIADLLSFLPIMLVIFFNIGWNIQLLTIFRLSRILRLFKLSKHIKFLRSLRKAVTINFFKYQIAFTFFGLVWLITAFTMYGFENHVNPYFSNIPKTMLWFISHEGDKLSNPITKGGQYILYITKLFGPIFFSIFTSITIVVFLDVVKFLRGEPVLVHNGDDIEHVELETNNK